MTAPASGRPSDGARSRGRRFLNPKPLSAVAVVAGWLGVYFAFRGHWLGVLLPIGTTALTFVALRRGDAVARRRSATLRRALDVAAARNRELERLRHLAATLLASTDSVRITDEVAQAVADLLEAESGMVALLVEEGRFLRVAAATGPLAQVAGHLLPVDGSLAGWVATHGDPLMSPDMEADPRSYRVPNLVLSMRTAVFVPLRAAGVVIGTVSAHNRHDGRAFTEHDLYLLQTLGDQVVMGLDRAMVLDGSRRSERALAAKNVELERATRLKSEFLANMSHELRTPLNAIIGFSDLILTESAGRVTAEHRDYLEAVLRNGRHLLGLINSVLDLSKVEAGRMALTLGATDMREAIVRAVADTASLRAAKAQACELRIAEGPLPILADGQRVRQILFNLLSNASKFTPDGGQITLSAVRTRAPLPLPAERLGDQPRWVVREAAWVSVMDTGVGIDRADLPKLFREFTQVDSSTSRQQQGTGLGLALSKRFVEMHGGVIGVDSIHGKGTAVWFFLPAEGPLRRATAPAGTD